MEKKEFDKFAEDYYENLSREIKISGEQPDYFAEYKVCDLALLIEGSSPSMQLKILDFGAGVGNSIPYFAKYFNKSDLTCTDISKRSLQIAEERFGDNARFVLLEDGPLPFPDNSFDLAFSACVFHHIKHDEHLFLLRELCRVLVPGGRLVIFEHNPYNVLTRRVVNSCIFDRNAELINAEELCRKFRAVGFENSTKVYRIFFPRLFSSLRVFEKYMGWIPFGAQYYVAGTKAEVV